MKTQINEVSFFKMACGFESALILLALLLGWFSDINPFANLLLSEMALLYGLLGTVPLLLIFTALYQINYTAVQNIRAIMMRTMAPSLHKLHWVDLLVLGMIAGISEEVLFRGLLQPWMESAWGLTAGLIGSNLVFGLVHAVTPLYALLAALVGIYLGLSMDYTEQRNLLTPIIIHGVYDFLAFLMVVHYYRKDIQSTNA